MLTSTRSPHVARLRRLHERKGRQQSGTFLAEGPDCVAAAIAAGWVREVVAVPGHALAEQAGAAGIEVHQADDRVVSAICDVVNPQGIVAECAIPSTHLNDVVSATGPLVMCDGLADPGNLGTIVRTAEAVGAAGVITTRGSVDAWNPKVVRASAGSIFRVPVVQVAHATEAVAAVQAARWTVVALTADADATVFDVIEHGRDHGAAPDRWAWLVGSEAHGVSAEALTDSALRARIPMRSSVESLNAAISVAICLYLAEGRRGTDGT